MTKEFILATGNDHKVRELRQILSEEIKDFDASALKSQKDYHIEDPVENGISFVQNALIKAQNVCDKTGKCAIADDSGLVVDVMGGAPGIFSARWSGKHGDDKANIDLLLKQMTDVSEENRKAKFVTAAVLVCPNGDFFVEVGEVEGSILFNEKGKKGFGYDPIFAPLGYDKSFAQLSPEEKNSISHRRKAFCKLAKKINELFSEK